MCGSVEKCKEVALSLGVGMEDWYDNKMYREVKERRVRSKR